MSEQKEKQQYLYQEIIEKNYDPEQFEEYLRQTKEGGDDLDNWTIQQLTDAVRLFQKSFDKENKEETKEQQKERQQIRQSTEKSQIIDHFIEEDMEKAPVKGKADDIDTSFDYFSNNETFRKNQPCVTAAPSSLLNATNLQVCVTKFQKKEGGMFEQSYVSYFINTPFLGKTVQRRYSDFEWIRETLQWLHPGIPVPPIAKKGQYRRYDDKHLRKRMMILEMFLSKLMQMTELRCDQVVQNFLTLEDRVAFQKSKANYKKSKHLIPFKNVRNIKGTLNFAFDPKANNFMVDTQRYFTDTQPAIKSIYKEFKAAATTLENCGDVLKGIGRRCDSLDELEKKFRKDHSLQYCSNNFFSIVSEAVSRMAEQIINQATIFRTQTYAFIKYQSLYMLNILENFDTLASFQEKYQSAKAALAKKKTKLFEEGIVQKWQCERKIDKNARTESINAMLPQETRKLSKIRDFYGLFNSEMQQQLNRHFATKNLQMGSCLVNCCRRETRLCSEMMMIWVDAQTNIMGMRENKFIKKC